MCMIHAIDRAAVIRRLERDGVEANAGARQPPAVHAPEPTRSGHGSAPAQGHPDWHAAKHLSTGRMAVGQVMQYLVVVHQDRPGRSCGVTVPDLPGCFSAGDTLADALQNAAEAIALHVEGMLTDGEPVPPPSDTIDPDGGIVATVTVDDGLMSERAVRVNVTLPSRLLALIDRVAKRTKRRQVRTVDDGRACVPRTRPKLNLDGATWRGRVASSCA